MWSLRSLPLLGLLASEAYAIWPLPVSQSTGDQVLWIDQNVPVYYNGASAVSASKLAENNADQLRRDLPNRRRVTIRL